MSKKLWGLSCAAMVALASSAQVGMTGVEVGDLAPPLKITEWVRGDEVDLTKDAAKKLHLVEFWATWCPPCKASVPLLTAIQKKYEKDLVIIGVTDPEPYQNTPTEIKQFVKKQGSVMDYTVAMDDRGATTEAYLPTDQPVAIPHAFLIGRDGRVVWQGSPLDPEMDTVIGDVVAGKYDMTAARKAVDVKRDLEKRFEALELAFQMGQMDVVWDGLIDIFKLDVANDTAMQLLTAIYVAEDGYDQKYREWVTGYMREHSGDARAMAALATTLLYIDDLTARVPDLALESARAAYEASGKSDPAALAAYAQALYQIGALERAIQVQSELVGKVDEPMREAAKGVLTYYQTCKSLQSAVQ